MVSSNSFTVYRVGRVVSLWSFLLTTDQASGLQSKSNGAAPPASRLRGLFGNRAASASPQADYVPPPPKKRNVFKRAIRPLLRAIRHSKSDPHALESHYGSLQPQNGMPSPTVSAHANDQAERNSTPPPRSSGEAPVSTPGPLKPSNPQRTIPNVQRLPIGIEYDAASVDELEAGATRAHDRYTIARPPLDAENANAAFYDQPSQPSSFCHFNLTISEADDSDNALDDSIIKDQLVRQICDKNDRIQMLRHCNTSQQQEVVRLRKAVQHLEQRNREYEKVARKRENDYTECIHLAEAWKQTAEKSQADVDSLQAKIVVNAAKEEAAVNAVNALREEHTACVETQRALAASQEECKALAKEKDQALQALNVVDEDYEVLAQHETTEWVADPRMKDIGLIEPNEILDLRQALAQSMRNHKTDITKRNEASEQVERLEQELESLHSAETRLNQRVHDLETLVSTFNIARKHQDLITTLFSAAKVAHSDAALTTSIESLIEQLVAEKVSLQLVTQLMQENATLKEKDALNQQELQQLEKKLAVSEKEKIALETEHIEADMRLKEIEKELRGILDDYTAVVQDRDDWRLQCEKKAFGEHSDVLYDRVKQRGDMYKHKLWESHSQVTHLEHELVNVRGWAAEQLESTGMYLEQRDWFEAQTKALGAQFATTDGYEALDMPFRPNWKSATEEERAEWEAAEGAKLTAGDREAYEEMRRDTCWVSPLMWCNSLMRLMRHGKMPRRRLRTRMLRMGR